MYEYVPGQTLDKWIDRGDTPLEKFLRWIVTLADAFLYAAQEGIVHRDMKPANVMIDMRSHAQIMDFGLAEALSDGKALTGGRIAGTPAYMSPEQARGDAELDSRSDQYSLGAMLYEIVSGQKPLRSSGRVAIAEIAERETPPLEPLRQVTADLRSICLKAMAANPDDRYADIADLGSDLEAYLDDRPILARPAGPVRKLRMWARRNVGTAIAAGTAVAMLLLVAVIASAAAIRLADASKTRRKQKQTHKRTNNKLTNWRKTRRSC